MKTKNCQKSVCAHLAKIWNVKKGLRKAIDLWATCNDLIISLVHLWNIALFIRWAGAHILLRTVWQNVCFSSNLLFESKCVLSVQIFERHKIGLVTIMITHLCVVFKIWSTFQNEIIFNLNPKFANNVDVGLRLTLVITYYFVVYGE